MSRRRDAVAMPARGRLLGVDLGEVRVGVAVTDPDQVVATPAETLEVEDGEDRDAIADLLAAAAVRHGAVGIVVGLPRTLSGREAAAAQRARYVAERAGQVGALPVDVWDERFTTAEADRVMLAQGARRRERRGAVDRVAATLILQGYLDARAARDPDRDAGTGG